MQKLWVRVFSISLLASLMLGGLSIDATAQPATPYSPDLGAAASYSVLAGATVTNTGPSTVEGNVGVSPSIGVPPHITGFLPGMIGPPGVEHDADAHAAAAQAANTSAFGALDQGCNFNSDTVYELTLLPQPLVPGVYCADSFTLTGNLNLSSDTGVWIFKADTTLTAEVGSSVTGGNALDVWWREGSSATLKVNSSMIGNILALTTITIQTGATLNGRALAQTGSVTLDDVTIYGPFCTTKATATAEAATATAAAATTATTAAEATATAKAGAPTATTNAPVEEEEDTPTATATLLPVMTALPGTGGAPIRSESPPWGLLVVAGFSIIILVFGVRAYRSTDRHKQ